MASPSRASALSRAPFLSLAAVVAIGCGAVTAPPSPAAAPASGGPADAGGAAASLPAPVDIQAAGAAAIEGTFGVASMVLADGKAWIAGIDNGIGVMDATGRLIRSVPVDSPCEGMDTGFGAVWTATCSEAGIVRVDVRGGSVSSAVLDDPIPGGEASIGAGEGAVWLVGGEASDELLGIDPNTLEVTTRYPIAPGGAGVRAGFGGVWVTRPDADELLRVDAASGQAVAIPVAGRPRSLAIGGGAVWVLSALGTVTRVDPATDTVTAVIRLGWVDDHAQIAVGGGSVWVRGGSQLLTSIDAGTNQVTARYGPASGNGAVAATADAVWATAPDMAMIWRLPIR